MKNFNVKQSGSEVTVSEINGLPAIDGLYCSYASKEIRSEIESRFEAEKSFTLPEKYTYIITPLNHAKISRSRITEGNNQPVHETPKSGHDLETCTEKEEKVTSKGSKFRKFERTFLPNKLIGKGTEQDRRPIALIKSKPQQIHVIQVFVNWECSNCGHENLVNYIEEDDLQTDQIETCKNCRTNHDVLLKDIYRNEK